MENSRFLQVFQIFHFNLRLKPHQVLYNFMPKTAKKSRFFMPFSKKLWFFYVFLTYNYVSSNLSLQFTIVPYHIFCKKEIIQKQKTQFIGHLDFTGKCIVRWYKELCSQVKLCSIIFICFIENYYYKHLPLSVKTTTASEKKDAETNWWLINESVCA